MSDLLDRTAVQVRWVKGPIHKLAGIDQHPAARIYHTCCGDVLSNVGGAVLTTRYATCLRCAPTGKGNATASGSPGQDGGDGA